MIRGAVAAEIGGSEVQLRVRRTPNGRMIPRPFLKWVGGKSQLIPAISRLMPRRRGRYFEPFLGGGAVFFHQAPRVAVLSDWNAELIDAYRAVRDHLPELMAELRRHRYEKDYYYEVRSQDPSSMSLPRRAARTIFLNKTGFNGLYRVNRKGKFNVPFGRYRAPVICDEHNLPACSHRLKGVELRRVDFEKALAHAEEGDVAYLDPPYVPASDSANFTSYTASGFGPDQQRRLASAVLALHRRGARFVLSNSDTPGTADLYSELLAAPGVRLSRVTALRAVNSKAGRRGRVGEVLIHNHPV